MDSDSGVLYICTGSEFVQEAEKSAKSVQEAMPDIPIALISDIKPNSFDFDEIIIVDEPEYDFSDQIKYIEDTPFNRTLYLDSDIYVEQDISDLFELLDYFDIAVAHNHDRSAYDVQEIPDAFPEYNTGVMVFNQNEKFSQLISNWNEYYKILKREGNSQNQPAFRKALYETNIRVATLRPQDNLMLRYPGHSIGQIRVFHGRLRKIQTPGSKKYVDIDHARELLNSEVDHRVWVNKQTLRGRKLRMYTDKKSIPRHIIDSYNWFRTSSKEKGLIPTLEHLYSKVLGK